MKQIKTTHIDTGGHGYYSVSKKDIELLGIKDQITSYSGHTLDRVYLEEDQDGTLLFDRAKELGIEVLGKSSYNLKFSVTHNYKPELFDWKPEVGQFVKVGQSIYKIFGIEKTRLRVVNRAGKVFRIPLSNVFKYVDSIEPVPAEFINQ